MHHASHPDVDRRLARIVGHIEGIRRMMGDEKSCVEILQQFKAVIAALESARQLVLKDHVHHCLSHAIEKKSASAAVEEIEAILSQIL